MYLTGFVTSEDFLNLHQQNRLPGYPDGRISIRVFTKRGLNGAYIPISLNSLCFSIQNHSDQFSILVSIDLQMLKHV